MKKLFIMFALLLSCHLLAAETPKQQKVQELLQVMDMDAMMETINQQINGMMQNVARDLNVSPEEQEIFDDYYQKVNKVMLDEMSWEKMEPLVLDIYSNSFSEEEITAMLNFYKTEVGQSILKKMPLVVQESMVSSQQMLQAILPKLQRLDQEFHQNLQAHRNQ